MRLLPPWREGRNKGERRVRSGGGGKEEDSPRTTTYCYYYYDRRCRPSPFEPLV